MFYSVLIFNVLIVHEQKQIHRIQTEIREHVRSFFLTRTEYHELTS